MSKETIKHIAVGILFMAIGFILGTKLGVEYSPVHRHMNDLVYECERSLPRDRSCEAVITAWEKNDE